MNINVTIHMENGKNVVMELYPDYAPNAVNSILEMIDQDCYKNLTIQRIAPDFVLQPWYDEDRMDERFQYVMPLEVEQNELQFRKYAVGMAGDGEAEASCGCFFIVTGDGCEQRLQDRFTPIGYVVEGFEEVERIMHVETADVDCGMEGVTVKEPVIPEVISQMSYELNDYKPQEVKKKYRAGYVK